MQDQSLLESVANLFKLLEDRKIEYVLVGGVALLTYVEGRNTEDIDLIMALRSLEKLPEFELHSRDANFIQASYQGLRVDILLTRNPLFARIQQDYVTSQQYFEQEIQTATVEGLVLLKLYALPSLYRQGSFAQVGIYENDVAVLLQAYEVEMAKLLAVLSEYLDEGDMKSVREIVGEIKRRIERFQGGGGER